MQTTVHFHNYEISFSDSDIVNPDDCIPQEEYNPHHVRAFLLHDAGYVLAVCFADSLQDAIDIAVDADKLDRYLVTEADAPDYDDDIYNCDRLSYLGNASEPFDIECLDCLELPAPSPSICALYGSDITL